MSTCSELSITRTTFTPGGVGEGPPGARLSIEGTGLGAVQRLTVGGVEMPVRAVDGRLATEVPPLLAAGPQAVEVRRDRCTARAMVTVSRLIAVARAGRSQVDLIDGRTLEPIGALETAFATGAVQLGWTFDGRGLVARAASGVVKAVLLRAGVVVPVTVDARGPFVLAQAATAPGRALLAVPGAGLFLLDTARAAVSPFPSPSREPLAVATPLDGFRALVLDRAGVVYALDHPFRAEPAGPGASEGTARDAGLVGPVPASAAATSAPGRLRAPAEVTMAQGGVVAGEHGPIGAVFDATDPPALLPMNSLTGRLGTRVLARGALGHVQFVSGDVLTMDSATPEVLIADITTLTGEIARLPLRDEPPAGIARTVTALSTYRLAAVVLRARDGAAVPEGDAVHFFDAQTEPPTPGPRVPLPGVRGIAGLAGRGDPFVVWTARGLVRIAGANPSEPPVRRELPGEGGDIVAVAVQP